MKRILLCTVIMSIAIFAAGCGWRVDNMSTADEDTITEYDFGSGEKLRTQLGVEEKWSEELAVSGKEVKAADIQATVSVPDTDHMCVLTMKADVFTGEKKKALLEAVCDAGSVYVLDEDAWPEWYAELEMNRASNDITHMLYKKEKYPDDFSEELLRIEQEYLKTCKEMKQRAATQDKQASRDYQENSYYGIRDEKHIRFDFSEGGASWSIEEPWSSLTVKEGVSDLEKISYHAQKYAVPENLCSMSEDQAVQAAEDFLEGAGYSGYGVYAVNTLVWTMFDNGIEEAWADGYSITFARNIDGIVQEVGTLSTHGDYDEVGEDRYEEGYGLENIKISINDKGILDCHIEYPYSMEEVSASAVSMLSYQQVKGVFRDILQNEPDMISHYDEWVHFKNMDLIYFRMADSGGDTYALLPVWILSNKEDDIYGNVYYDNALMINAIDGSQIE